jgi:hypothetical protein
MMGSQIPKGFALVGLAYVLAGVAALAMIGTAFYKAYQAGADSARLECQQAAEEQRALEADRAEKAAKDLEVARAKRKIVYRDVVREVDKIVVQMRDAPCLNDAGVRAINRAISGKVPDPAKPDGSLRSPTPPR